MIEIKKGTEPAGLRELRDRAAAMGLSPEEAYNTLRGSLKDGVRDALISEQGQLCAYCMCKIPRDDVDADIAPIVIEHYVPRNPADGRDTGQGLDYQNLLAVCNGNRARKGRHRFIDLTCDAHRGNTEFKKVNPCKKETLLSITYTLDGKIDSSDPDVKYDLENTLNLNCPASPIPNERKATLDGLIQYIDDLGEISERELLSDCKRILNSLTGEINSKTPYVGILIWYLQTIVDALSGR